MPLLPRASLRQLGSLAWRESRTARRRLLVSMSSITFGVAGLVAIDSLAANATGSVHEQARSLVGGDVAIGLRDTTPPEVARVLDSLASHGTRIASQTSFVSMASGGDSAALRLVQVRAVTPGYPLFGAVRTTPAGAWEVLQHGAHAVVDPAVLSDLAIQIGDSIALGGVRFAVTGTVRDVSSDVALSATLGPRVYIPAAFLPATHLLTMGSRSQRDVVLRLPATVSEEAFAERFGQRFARAGARVRTAEQNASRVSDTIDFLRNFLAIIGLVALMLGGLGVASGVRAFVLRKIDTVAVLRCLGATSGQVLAIYVTQAGALGLAGAALGAGFGVLLQFVLGSAVARFLPAGMQVAIVPVSVLAGIAAGGWVALVCALQPLLALRRVSPLQAIRRESDHIALGVTADWASRLVALAAVASLFVITVARARRWQEGFAFAIGILLVLGTLVLASSLLSRLARASVRPAWPFVLRHGVASLHRPGNQTRAVIVALGFGVFLVGTLYQTQSALLAVMTNRLAQLHANMVFFDIQSDEAPGVDSVLRAHRTTVVARIPVLTVRVGAINGRSRAQLLAAPAPRDSGSSGDSGAGGRQGVRVPAVGREWRASFADTLSEAERVVAGNWFGREAAGEVSLDSAAAARLHVGVGDTIQWDLQGVPIVTRVSSLRIVDRTQLQPSFQVLFPTRLVRGAPMQWVELATATPDSVPAVQRGVVGRFPNVSTVDFTLVEATIASVLTRIHAAIRGLTMLCALLAIPVIFSAVAATRRARYREAVLLKVLGATRRQVIRVLLTEYLVLGILGGVAGIVLSMTAAWSLTHFVFGIPFVGALAPALGIAGMMIAVVILVGVLTGRQVFSSTPMAALRE